MSEFCTVAKVDEIPPGQARCFEVDERVIAVFNIDGQFAAIDDMCPHMGASLSEGEYNPENSTVACPWHGWRFNVFDGTWADNPRVKTDSFEVRIVGDEVQVCATPRQKCQSQREE